MFVKDFMTKDPITVAANASLTHTAELMKKNKLKRLPVMNQTDLVGIITEKDVAKALPSAATSLSKFEINYLTDKITVADVMSDTVVATSPDTTVEEATMIMRQKDIGCLPVLDQNRLIGIITESNVFDALTKLFGLNRSGLRITIEVTDRIGVIADLTTLIKNLDLTIISLATYSTTAETARIILRIAADSADKIVDALSNHNYNVIHWTILS